MAEDSTRRLLKVFGIAVTNLEDALEAGRMFNLQYRKMIRTDTELYGTWPRTCPVGSSEEVSDVFLIDRGFSDRAS